MNSATIPARKGLLPALGLFFLAPLVAEYLLGDLPITMLSALIAMAPMYGGGALLIREVARRTGRGWPTIVLLALAYGVLEEAFTTQSLFNPNYLSLNFHLLQPAYIPVLGMGGWWTVFVLALHTVWSISVPIALVEASVPGKATAPWLGNFGLGVTVFVFAFGIAVTTMFSYKHDPFVASTMQFIAAGAAIVCIVGTAFLIRIADGTVTDKFVPNPWLAGIAALAAGTVFLFLPPKWGWWAMAAILLLELGIAGAVLALSKRKGWTMRHKLALASGAALAYAGHAFLQMPVVGHASVLVAKVGNAVFALGAIALIAFAAKRTVASEATQPAGCAAG
jgi:hypothetical protein